jgi:hypothetical protein
VVGLVHLLRYIHGYQRPTSKGVREEMRRTGCGAAWERRDWKQYEREGRKEGEATEEREGFDSGDEDGRAGGGRRGRAKTTRERMRDEEWVNRHYREYEEGDDDICEAGLAAAAIAAGDDDELLRELEESVTGSSTCIDGQMSGEQRNEHRNQEGGDENRGSAEGKNKRNEAGEDDGGMQQQANGAGDGGPGMSTGEAETTGESFQLSRKQKSEAYRGITGRGSRQPTEGEGEEREPGTSSRGTDNAGGRSELKKKQRSEAYKINNKNKRAQNAGKSKGKGKEIVDD